MITLAVFNHTSTNVVSRTYLTPTPHLTNPPNLTTHTHSFPGTEIWITEYAFAHQEAAASKEFLDQTLAWFDNTPYIGRYTYFGAFRSDVSNVGPNAPFLDPSGKLTAIGQSYLGINGTGIAPGENAAAPGSSTGPGRYVWAVVAVVVAKALTDVFR